MTGRTSFIAAVWVTCALVAASSSSAIELSSFEFMLGDAWNLDTTLSVGFNRRERGAWELQFVHHKIHLTNTTEEIQHFEITHGLNVVTVNRTFETLPVAMRVGGGFIIAHPESVVRGLSWYDEGGIFDSGYHLTGPAILGGVGKHFRVSSRLSVGLEVQLIAAWAKVPVAEGSATAPNVALHGMVGVGYRL